ncbi:hypothetical protein BDR22DRAFT_963289 [Usnea florida]
MYSKTPTLLLSLIAIPFALALTTSHNSATNATSAPPSRYYLKTRDIDNGNSDKNNLYLSSYHSGAGENDVVLQPLSDFSADNPPTVGFLNGTHQQFDLRTPGIPWSFVMDDTEATYAGWKFVYIQPGYGPEDFFFNSSGLQWGLEGYGFAGWLACDWWHGQPQLFWKYYYDPVALPSSCTQVELLPVAV